MKLDDDRMTASSGQTDVPRNALSQVRVVAPIVINCDQCWYSEFCCWNELFRRHEIHRRSYVPTTPADVDAIVNDALSVVGRERQSTTSFVGPKVCVCWLSSIHCARRDNCRDCRGWNELVIRLWSVKTSVWLLSIRCSNFIVAAKVARVS